MEVARSIKRCVTDSEIVSDIMNEKKLTSDIPKQTSTGRGVKIKNLPTETYSFTEFILFLQNKIQTLQVQI